MRLLLTSVSVLFAVWALSACGGEADRPAPRPDSSAETAAADLAAGFIVAEAPGEPIPATDVRQYGVDEAEVVTTGRIESFVDGFAVMTIVDLKVPF